MEVQKKLNKYRIRVSNLIRKLRIFSGIMLCIIGVPVLQEYTVYAEAGLGSVGETIFT